MISNPDPIYERYNIVWDAVEGWLGDRVVLVLQWIDHLYKVEQVEGDIAEIGVHHGKFLLSMTPLLRSGESAIAIDIWGDQRLNVDQSGSGSLEIFKGHAADIAPEADIRIMSGDSMALTSDDIRRVMSKPKVKLFSVDGGHTPSHVINDLKLAQDLLAPGGIVALDDFFGPAWPSVTEGAFEYLAHHNVRLAPFLIFQNKLWLTTFSEHGTVLDSADAYFQARSGHEWFSRWRYSQIKGWKVLTFA